MQLEADKVTASGKSLTHTYAPDELTLEDATMRFSRPVEVAVQAVRKNEEVQLRGVVKAEVEVLCDRCLSAVKVLVQSEFDATYVAPADDFDDESKELQQNDLSRSLLENGMVNIDQLVCEQVLLSLPTRVLCQEECRGLCALCGADLNAAACNCETTETDARWAALAAINRQLKINN